MMHTRWQMIDRWCTYFDTTRDLSTLTPHIIYISWHHTLSTYVDTALKHHAHTIEPTTRTHSTNATSTYHKAVKESYINECLISMSVLYQWVCHCYIYLHLHTSTYIYIHLHTIKHAHVQEWHTKDTWMLTHEGHMNVGWMTHEGDTWC